jgi:hypothetical protein
MTPFCTYHTVTFAREHARQHLKKGENQVYRRIYGCPEKYLTQEKTDETHETEQASAYLGSH